MNKAEMEVSQIALVPEDDEHSLADEAHDRDNYLAAQVNDDAACAARYRWLRDRNDPYVQPRFPETDGTVWEVTFYSPFRILDDSDDTNMDQAIDAALAAAGAPQ